MFKRASCGCVYLPIANGKSITVEKCDDTGDGSFGFFLSYCTVSDKDPIVSEVAQERIIDEIRRLISLGKKLEQVQSLLGIEVKR